MREFTCTRCGTCCKDPATATSHPPSSGLVFPLNSIYLPFFDWEKRTIAESRGPNHHLIPGEAIYDKNNDMIIVLNYTIPSPSCHFLNEKVGCTIYDIRPLVCRGFPAVMGAADIGDDLKLKTSKCPSDLTLQDLKDILPLPTTKHTVIGCLHNRYGHSFRSRLTYDFYIQKVTGLLLDLMEDGIIHPERAPENIDISRLVDISDLLEEHLGVIYPDTLSLVEAEVRQYFNTNLPPGSYIQKPDNQYISRQSVPPRNAPIA